ncbi:cupin domain-containing protein [Bowmanella dokdonensis]|uniref:Cupin domain-containing protein n=1 Tax=Bowmanella dokdonensis TaxID=751969 RepID=A0A939DPL4_9ALTE|nr:cupin domain-containing protein [Bowmanella dokdonensis]MBN7825611.1 cupin domain-containing protein [Bowmanella dokdonensis]
MKRVSTIGFLLLFSSPCLIAGDNALVISHKDSSLQWGPCPAFIPKGCEIAILNGQPDKENLDIFFRVPADSHIPKHNHTSQERMVLVSGTLDVNYQNHEKATIHTGDYAFGPAKLPHTAYCHKGERCVLYIGFVAPLDANPIKE